MSSQFSSTRTSQGTKPRPPPPQTVTYETRTIGSHEKIQLLRAPAIETDKIWKNRAFKYAYSRLRPKLCTRIDNEYKPETLITVFSDHFPLSTQNAEHEADEAVRNFQKKLQDVSYLTPVGFYDTQGDRKCHRMIKKDRPPNVAYLKVSADIPMGEFASMFEGKSCHLEYFLHLPQSTVQRSFFQQATSLESIDTASTIDKNEPGKPLLSSMFTSNDLEEGDDAEQGLSSLQATSSPKKKRRRRKKKDDGKGILTPMRSGPQTLIGSGDEESSGQEGEAKLEDLQQVKDPDASNDSFDFDIMRKQTPKLAFMIKQGRTSHKTGQVPTYLGPLGLLDTQSTYEDEITRRFEPFTLEPDAQGIRRVVTYKGIESTLKQMSHEIKFEAFCNEFRNDYVGEEDDDELLTQTVDKIREDLERIKMVYTNKSTGKIVYTSPETVFKKMNAFIELLPQDATGWSFCLPWLFFAALPNDLQEEMRNQGFSRPPVATLITKKLQSRALSQCRDSAVKAFSRLQETKKQVRAMVQSQNCRQSNAGIFNYMQTLDEYGIEDEHSHYPNEQAQVLAYQQRSRAETTMYNAYNQRKKDEFLPEGFQQAVKTINGVTFPCHPNDPNKWSAFPTGFRGCYYCGATDHGFTQCPRKHESDAVTVFHWNLHCHKPELWFKNKNRRATMSTQQQQHRQSQHVQFKAPLADSIQSTPQQGTGRGRAAVKPAWMTRQQSNVIQQDQQEEDDNYATGDGYLPQGGNIRKQFVTIVQCHNIREKRRMPISSQNELPHLDFGIGQARDAMTLSFLYDTGAAINTGYLPYHKKIMKEYPQVVESFEEFNGDNPFEPIKLMGAITNPAKYDREQHGILSAVIRYRTPYIMNNGNHFVLCFALGEDMSVNTILGVPGILEVALEPRFIKKEFLAHNIRAKFNIMYRETTKWELPKVSNTIHALPGSIDQESVITRVKEEETEQELSPPETLSAPAIAVLQAASLSEAPLDSGI